MPTSLPLSLCLSETETLAKVIGLKIQILRITFFFDRSKESICLFVFFEVNGNRSFTLSQRV